MGKTTNNVAEYRGLILGLREALERGVSEINAKGDSTLVCKQVTHAWFLFTVLLEAVPGKSLTRSLPGVQVTGKWRVNSLQLQQLCKEAKFLAGKFKTFSISYVPRVWFCTRHSHSTWIGCMTTSSLSPDHPVLFPVRR